MKTKKNKRMIHQSVRENRPTQANFIIHVLLKRKLILISVFTGILALVAATTIFQTPMYKANSKILVEREIDSEKSLLFRMNLNMGFENYDWLKSEVEILQSIPVAMRVIDSLKLFHRSLQTADNDELNQALQEFSANLTIDRPKDTNVIEIGYESEDRATTARVVNELVEAYMDYRYELYSESGSSQFLDRQIQLVEVKLNGLEQRLSQFKQNNELTTPEAQRDILLSKIAEYEKALTTVRTKRISKETKLNIVKEQKATNADVNIPVTESSDSPSREKYITKLRGEQLDLQLQRNKLLQKYTPEYEEVVNMDKAIENIRGFIRTEIDQIIYSEETAIRALNAEEDVLKRTIAELNGQVKRLAYNEYELNQFSRGISDNRDVYSMLLKQREEARISQAKLERGVKIKVISPARVPSRPFKPEKKRSLLLGIVLGTVTALGVVFLLEHFETSTQRKENASDPAGLPVWGSVSTIKVARAANK
ncbi:MAG: GumC family protein [Candidatus Zhuqueibacterota bacterium]